MSGGLPYRGRLAPSPTGYLHLGHARTFWVAWWRARQRGGILVLRNEDLDRDRCRPPFVTAMLEDLRWLGLDWQEGPDCGGPHAPYDQSRRQTAYVAVFEQLRATGLIYPCTCSRKEVLQALGAPHAGEEEPVYPGTCRPENRPEPILLARPAQLRHRDARGRRVNWRFRVPDGERLDFVDGAAGPQSFVAGRDFGDFVVWRHDDLPSYQLAVVADDHAMRITEVVRGADLLLSTARQLLLYRALGWPPPAFFHVPLMTDAQGRRLAKRHDALSLRALRAAGAAPAAWHEEWAAWLQQALPA
ncbi:MAG: tRNA glutamyl-Q(34) synthetase GluQRS [Verrucomicrobiae bacterium]|nr:tRNA glutamyl-Q(34) synthetase GluQRS [Verrucomicrobiae bacterium]